MSSISRHFLCNLLHYYASTSACARRLDNTLHTPLLVKRKFPVRNPPQFKYNRKSRKVSDNPKCKELLVAYRRRSLARVELQEVFYEEKWGHISCLGRMYFKQFLGYKGEFHY